MSVIVTMELTVKPERLQGLKDFFEAVLPDTRAYDGFEGIHVTQDVTDENRVVLIQYWASKQTAASCSPAPARSCWNYSTFPTTILPFAHSSHYRGFC